MSDDPHTPYTFLALWDFWNSCLEPWCFLFTAEFPLGQSKFGICSFVELEVSGKGKSTMRSTKTQANKR